MTPLPTPHLAGVTLRPARPDDAADVHRLAALDSRRVPEQPVLLAEQDGVLRAALSLSSGAVVADPFAPSAHLVALLRRHAGRAPRARGSRRIGASAHAAWRTEAAAVS